MSSLPLFSLLDPLPHSLRLPTYFLLPILLAYLFRNPVLSFLTPKGIKGIPALPDPSPLTGDIGYISNIAKQSKDKRVSFGRIFDSLSKELGPVCQVRISFMRNFVILADYQAVEAVLNDHHHFDRASDTSKIFRHILPTGQISQPTNKMWKHHRRIIGPAMTSKYLSLTTPRANTSVSDMIDLFKAKMEKSGGKGWKVASDLQGATMDAICGMAFGGSWGITKGSTSQVKGMKDVGKDEVDGALFKTKRPEIADSVWHVFDAIPSRSSFPDIAHFINTLTPSYRYHDAQVKKYLSTKLNESRNKMKELGDSAVDLADNTLDMMVARQARGEDWMSDNEMLDEVLQYLVAGTETSGVTLTWWMKYMSNHPAVQWKLSKHILDNLPELQDRQPTFEDLNADTLPYLEAVVHETLRMSRTASGYTREVIKDTTILGYHLPKGAHILITTASGLEDETTPWAGPTPTSKSSSSTTTHSSTSLNGSHENGNGHLAEKVSQNGSAPHGETDGKRKVGHWKAGTGKMYDPERWLNDEGKFDLNAGPSLPFSMGQRGCFGKNLALLELRLFMCQLILNFYFAPLPENQNSMDHYETIATHPVQSYIRPVFWDSEEALKTKPE